METWLAFSTHVLPCFDTTQSSRYHSVKLLDLSSNHNILSLTIPWYPSLSLAIDLSSLISLLLSLSLSCYLSLSIDLECLRTCCVTGNYHCAHLIYASSHKCHYTFVCPLPCTHHIIQGHHGSPINFITISENSLTMSHLHVAPPPPPTPPSYLGLP